MGVIQDIKCEVCKVDTIDVWVEAGRVPKCETCGGIRSIIPSGFHHDLLGQPTYSDATGKFHTSQSEKRAHLRTLGYEEAGDKVHGARADHTIHNTAFSYSGQSEHVSTGERAHQRGGPTRGIT